MTPCLPSSQFLTLRLSLSGLPSSSLRLRAPARLRLLNAIMADVATLSCARCSKPANLQCPKCVELKLPREDDAFWLTIRDEIIPRAVSWFMGEAGLEENTQISTQHSNFLKNLPKKCQGVCWKSKIDPEKGVPNFWLYALQNNDYIDKEISLVEMPERSKKKLMALATNVMRDDSDKGLGLQ